MRLQCFAKTVALAAIYMIWTEVQSKTLSDLTLWQIEYTYVVKPVSDYTSGLIWKELHVLHRGYLTYLLCLFKDLSYGHIYLAGIINNKMFYLDLLLNVKQDAACPHSVLGKLISIDAKPYRKGSAVSYGNQGHPGLKSPYFQKFSKTNSKSRLSPIISASHPFVDSK